MKSQVEAETQIGIEVEKLCVNCQGNDGCPLGQLKSRIGPLPRTGTIVEIGDQVARDDRLVLLFPDDPTNVTGNQVQMTVYCQQHDEKFEAYICFYQTLPSRTALRKLEN